MFFNKKKKLKKEINEIIAKIIDLNIKISVYKAATNILNKTDFEIFLSEDNISNTKEVLFDKMNKQIKKDIEYNENKNYSDKELNTFLNEFEKLENRSLKVMIEFKNKLEIYKEAL